MEVNEQPIMELVELVRNHKVDPWEIDIRKIVDIYGEKLLVEPITDIRTPARVLHSAATLLRIKSEHALNGNGSKGLVSEELEELLDLDIPNLGELTIEYFVPRKLTLEDLLGALREVIKEMPKRKEKIPKRLDKLRIDVAKDPDVRLEQMMEALLEKIRAIKREGKSVSLFSLVKERKRGAVVLTFYLLLSLYAERKVILEQPEMFGDIVVKTPEENTHGNEGG